MEKLLFSWKFSSGHFYGQPFIKTVRGPLQQTTISNFGAFSIYHTFFSKLMKDVSDVAVIGALRVKGFFYV